MLFLLSRKAFSFLAKVVFFNRLQKYQLSSAKKMFAENFGVEPPSQSVGRFAFQKKENLNGCEGKIGSNKNQCIGHRALLIDEN